MITREKLQLWIEQNAQDDWGSDMSTIDETEVLKLALAHLDSARARRVGEAVLAAIGTVKIETLEKTLREEYEGTGTGTYPRVLMAVIVRALRGEP